MPRPRRRSLLALFALVFALAAPASAGALVVGIAEQTPDVFNDPRFVALGIRAARLSVAWDVFDNRAQTRALDRWLRAAKADGVSPLISFDHHFPSQRGHSLPTPGALAHQFRIFRARYPWVHDFATWNEANHCGEPTCHRPALVASYYRALRQTCRSCTVLGAELLDEPGMIAWVRGFDRALGGQPAIWGLHNYLGANRLQVSSTLSLLRATRSEIWFTETGGVVARHNHSSADFPQSPAHAARVTAFIFNRLARLSRRITRVYLYQWNAGPGARQSWDSGLLGPEPGFAARPAFSTFVRVVAALPQSTLTTATAAALLGDRRNDHRRRAVRARRARGFAGRPARRHGPAARRRERPRRADGDTRGRAALRVRGRPGPLHAGGPAVARAGAGPGVAHSARRARRDDRAVLGAARDDQARTRRDPEHRLLKRTPADADQLRRPPSSEDAAGRRMRTA